MNPVDKLKLGIGLAEFDGQTQLSGRSPALGLYLGQRLASVDFGLALAEQIQVGAVQNIDDRVHVVGVRILLEPTPRGTRAFSKPVLSRRLGNVHQKDRIQNTEVRCQKSEVRSQNRELRTANPEPRTPNPELRTPNFEPRTSNPELRTPN